MKSRLFLLSVLLMALASTFGACSKSSDDNGPDTSFYIDRDSTLINDYIRANNLTGFERDSVVYISITQPGTGPLPTLGQTIITKYTGTTLDGQVFDQTQETIVGFPFVLRTPTDPALGVISGWAVAFRNLRKGSKAILLIPSELAYKGAATGNIPPHSILRFDVEVVNIK